MPRGPSSRRTLLSSAPGPGWSRDPGGSQPETGEDGLPQLRGSGWDTGGLGAGDGPRAGLLRPRSGREGRRAALTTSTAPAISTNSLVTISTISRTCKRGKRAWSGRPGRARQQRPGPREGRAQRGRGRAGPALTCLGSALA